MLYIGLDPGATGAMAALDHEGKVFLQVCRFKNCTKQEIDTELKRWRNMEGATVALLEKVSSSPQMGVVSAFTFGRGYGFLDGLLTANRIRFDEATPQKWQKPLGLIQGGRKLKQGSAEKKRIHKQKAQQLWPDLKITLDMADALLIAEYLRRRERGIL